VSELETRGRGEGFRWPPPGLERIQGDLWRIVRSGWLAAALLVLPLLFVTTTPWDLATLGPLADAWWVGAVSAAFGLAFALDAFLRLARMANRSMHAVERGYDLRTLACVVSDRRRDMGFLLQGDRYFSVLERPDREMLVSARLLAPSLLAAGSVWLCLSMALGLVFAARGWLGPEALRYLTLVPAAGMYLVGIVVSVTDDIRVRRARRDWHSGAWEDDLDPGRIERWRDQARLAPRGDEASARARLLGRAGIAFTVAAVVVLLPVLLLLPASAVGPMLANVSFPSYDDIQRRAAELEVYRVHRVSPDPAVTPGEAGRLLQTLAYVGSDEPVAVGEVEPAVRIVEPWLPVTGGDHVLGASPPGWHASVFELVDNGPTGEQRAYLEDVADHPARADFSRLARALRVDVASARWRDPLPAAAGGSGVSQPRLLGVRMGAHAHVAAAAVELLAGRAAAAETLVREVLSVGFLLADQGPTLMDNLVGHALIREGGLALEHLFEATGRPALAAELSAARATGERAAARMHSPRPASTEALARMLPDLVLDSTTVRGLAWESFSVMSTLAPCMNLNRVVFGPDEAHRAFVDSARSALVRWPSEEPLFRLAARGLFERSGEGAFRPLRLLLLSVRSGEGSCGDVLGRFSGRSGG
jgi:hypothetical protein